MTRIRLRTLLSRAVRLRCPRCGGGKLFKTWMTMYPTCPNCNLKYERDPGYFLGSAYINYGLTSLILTAAYIGLHVVGGISNRVLLIPLVGFFVLFPLAFFRYARALWLALDGFLDAQSFDTDQD